MFNTVLIATLIPGAHITTKPNTTKLLLNVTYFVFSQKPYLLVVQNIKINSKSHMQ